MVQRAEHEPTMEEIVVALRETRRVAGRPASNAGSRRAGGNRTGNVVTYPQSWVADVADLRDNETERLLTENARLNERIIFLLKVIEHEQTRFAARMAAEADRDAIMREMRAALKAELRPSLLVFLRLLEKQLAEPNRPFDADAPSAWIVELIRRLDGENPHQGAEDPLLLPRPRASLWRRLGRFFHALGF
jgi:hypothetical protein